MNGLLQEMRNEGDEWVGYHGLAEIVFLGVSIPLLGMDRCSRDAGTVENAVSQRFQL